MSLALNLPGATTIDWMPVSRRVDWQSIFRTLNHIGFRARPLTEALALVALSAGLLSLFLGLAVL